MAAEQSEKEAGKEAATEKAAVKPAKKDTAKKDTKKVTGPVAILEITEGDQPMGTVKIQLFSKKAPKTVENFVALATGKKEWKNPKTGESSKKPLYDGTIFHRVIPNFMIQGGDPIGNGTGDPGYKFADEFDKSDNFDHPGILAMANSGPDSNGSQFFITVAPTTWLNQHHTIFGEVTEGMEVVRKISEAQRDPSDKPLKEIKIKKLTIKK